MLIKKTISSKVCCSNYRSRLNQINIKSNSKNLSPCNAITRYFSSSKEEKSEKEKFENVDDKNLENEIEESEEVKQAKINLEQKKKFLSSEYTPEELDLINDKGSDIVFMEIKEKNRKKLYFAKRISLFFNIPLSLALIYLIDYFFGDIKSLDSKKKIAYYLSLFLDYTLFLNAITILAGCRNIVLLAKYIPKEKTIEFTKLSLVCKPYILKEKISDLKRVGSGSLTPFISLKNKYNNSIYSMNSVGIWKDRKLYNAIFPPEIRKTKNKKDGTKFLDL